VFRLEIFVSQISLPSFFALLIPSLRNILYILYIQARNKREREPSKGLRIIKRTENKEQRIRISIEL